jgi:serine/threonine-protein kinase
LLAVHEWGERAGTFYLVTDRYPSRTVGHVVRKARLAPKLTLELLWPVAEALDACHERGLAHQNLTAKSLLLAGDDALLDGFAIAAGVSEWKWESLDPRAFRYGSPEAMRGEPPEPATNVYSLAAILVHLLTGRPPFAEVPLPPSNAAWAAALLHVTEPPPRPSARVSALGREIDEVIAWGMAKEPADRPPSATTLLEAAEGALRLGRVTARRAAAAPQAAPTRGVTTSPPRRRAARVVRLGAILAAAAVGAVAGVLADPFGEDSPRAEAERPATPAVATLGERRAELRSELAEASLPAEQAEAAEELASVYRATADRRVSPALAAAARDAAGAYAALGTSAAGGSEAAFDDASADVESAERGVRTALANLQNKRK